jgi:hypothetical protein
VEVEISCIILSPRGLNSPLKGAANSVDKFVQKLATICKLLQAGGGADGIRTHYLLTASQTLSQLSYSPTPRSLAKNSNKLNHLCQSDNLTKHVIINRHANR